ncbi:hypothetical protein [Sulfidibacter corallicola]|uniref:Uncharacterized protein n=1 Tax=Sulfidibacter corallicola TaxID=2818388 RepID=A0A8A4TN94_SULCO|nr:hypothetical protein [Sulfidibacter corallicola]QTD50907.1 hypothetical protein J3U87_00430 [Sulfidibacter corallicola]
MQIPTQIRQPPEHDPILLLVGETVGQNEHHPGFGDLAGEEQEIAFKTGELRQVDVGDQLVE